MFGILVFHKTIHKIKIIKYFLQNCKAYSKKSVKYVPVIGWAWKFAESVFLERNWEKDKDTIGVQVSELGDHPDPMMVSIIDTQR